jgi:hypothetical protein
MARKISVQNEFLDSVGPRIKEDILKQETITLEGQCLDTVCDKKKKKFRYIVSIEYWSVPVLQD